jgi:hypothetical protein
MNFGYIVGFTCLPWSLGPYILLNHTNTYGIWATLLQLLTYQTRTYYKDFLSLIFFFQYFNDLLQKPNITNTKLAILFLEIYK